MASKFPVVPVAIAAGLVGAAGIGLVISRQTAAPAPRPPAALPPPSPAPAASTPAPAQAPAQAPSPPPATPPASSALAQQGSYPQDFPAPSPSSSGLFSGLAEAAPLLAVLPGLWQSYRDNRTSKSKHNKNANLPAEGSVFRADNSSRVYLMQSGQKCWFVTAADLQWRGYATAPVQVFPAAVVDSIPDGPYLGSALAGALEGNLVAIPGNPAIYHVTGGVKHHVLTMATVNRLGGLSVVKTGLPPADIAAIPVGDDEP